MSLAKNTGFTLFEVIVVMAIIAILSAMGVQGFQDASINGRIATASSELVQVINTARSRAVVTHSQVLLLQGPGTSATDVATVTAGDWSEGWRLVRSGQVIYRNVRSRQGDSNGLRLIVANAGGTAINGIGFNQYGHLVDSASASLTQATVTICSPTSKRERGRTLTIALMGRVVNTTVINPTC